MTLRKYTDSAADKFSKEHQGSTGWEYEMMMAWFDGYFYYSTPQTTKEYTQVTSHHTLKVHPKVDQKTRVLSEEVLIDEKSVGTKKYSDRLIVDKRIQKFWSNQRDPNDVLQPRFVCHFHSHPQNQIPGQERRVYSFFSPTDIQSLVTGSTPMMGLVADRLWLLVNPVYHLGQGQLTTPSQGHLQEITQVEVATPETLEDKAGELMREYGWKLYVGGFKQNLRLIS